MGRCGTKFVGYEGARPRFHEITTRLNAFQYRFALPTCSGLTIGKRTRDHRHFGPRLFETVIRLRPTLRENEPTLRENEPTLRETDPHC